MQGQHFSPPLPSKQPATFKPRGEFGGNNGQIDPDHEAANESTRKLREKFIGVLHSKEFASASDAHQQEFLREMARQSYVNTDQMNFIIRDYWKPETAGQPAPVLRPLKR